MQQVEPCSCGVLRPCVRRRCRRLHVVCFWQLRTQPVALGLAERGCATATSAASSTIISTTAFVPFPSLTTTVTTASKPTAITPFIITAPSTKSNTIFPNALLAYSSFAILIAITCTRTTTMTANMIFIIIMPSSPLTNITDVHCLHCHIHWLFDHHHLHDYYLESLPPLLLVPAFIPFIISTVNYISVKPTFNLWFY